MVETKPATSWDRLLESEPALATDLVARVLCGADLLDQVEPGWHRLIACNRLSMESCDRCILGQLHGDFHTGGHEVFRRIPGGRRYSAADHGFTLHDDEQLINWKADGPDLADLRAEVEPIILARFAALADLWRGAVVERLEADTCGDER